MSILFCQLLTMEDLPGQDKLVANWGGCCWGGEAWEILLSNRIINLSICLLKYR